MPRRGGGITRSIAAARTCRLGWWVCEVLDNANGAGERLSGIAAPQRLATLEEGLDAGELGVSCVEG
jgi:hypothetical protein